jgi:hypothetical protein
LLGGRLESWCFFSAGGATDSSCFESFCSSFKGAEGGSYLGFLVALAGADLGLPLKFSGISQGLDGLKEL